MLVFWKNKHNIKLIYLCECFHRLKPLDNIGKTKKTKMFTDLHITYMV